MSRLLTVLTLLMAVVAGCGDGGEGQGSGAGSSLDASARLACRHFFDIADDVQKGVLSDEEIVDKLQEVYDTGHVSRTPSVARAVTLMLSGAKQEDQNRLARGIRLMGASCTS